MEYARITTQLIEEWLQEKELIILYGARQVGKTTLVKKLCAKKKNALYLNCETPTVKDLLESKKSSSFKLLFGENQLIVLDEAQKVNEIGEILKLIYDDDDFKLKIIATGSSSFDLANKVSEPMTGRNIKFIMYPLSMMERYKTEGWVSVSDRLDETLVYGNYPAILNSSKKTKERRLVELANDYLFRDILEMESLRSTSKLRNLLRLIALQVGAQVSTNELAQNIGLAQQTVETYIDLLEKSFIIFRLHSYNKNLRNEIKKSKKIFFYDLGIRNAIINNFNTPENRTDIGALWENYCILERFKTNEYNQLNKNFYFWRTYDQAEIDLIEEKNNQLEIFEFKWKTKKKQRFPESFLSTYNVTKTYVITPKNMNELLNEPF